MIARRMVLLLAGIAAIAAAAQAQARKPRLPPGRDPGGAAVAVAATGFDYTRPEVARVLARDGEGDLVGWDLVTGDNRPHSSVDDGTTALAGRIAAPGARRIVPIRIDPAQPSMLAAAVAFTARTPARMLVVAVTVTDPARWSALADAAARHPQLLIVVVARGETASSPQSAAPPNLLRIGTAAAGLDMTVGGAAADATVHDLLAAVLPAPERCERPLRGGAPVHNIRADRLLALLPPLPGPSAMEATTCTILDAP